jgi:hypothetical protein
MGPTKNSSPASICPSPRELHFLISLDVLGAKISREVGAWQTWGR